jgi:hypothetical protein
MFFDYKNTLLFEVENFYHIAATEVIGADERIIGIKAKLYSNC